MVSSCTKEEPLPEAFPAIYAPVCGPDGKEYVSECYARSAGITELTGCGHSAAYAYDFGIPNGESSVTRSGNEILVKFSF
ncbi:MAG: hypothetical protein ACI9TK_000414 [Flavobacteriaceae bacterium]|jgi:hypothetical protein|tara:strand:+ start:365 stop:604 length:240 start_codon:yes stop_codon:yes gene_type:complete